MKLKTTRRNFLKGSAATFAVLAIGLDTNNVFANISGQSGNITPFVKINSDGKVIAVIKHFEMGQGTTTGLSTLIAEELDLKLEDIQYEFAPSNTAVYKNLDFGAQLTGGSSSIRNSYEQYRKAGATARTLLIEAAGKQWNVDPKKLKIKNGKVVGKGNSAHFGQLVETASKLPIPAKVELKKSSKFKIIGKNSARKDASVKVNGQAKYSMDVQLDNQIVVVIKKPDQFKATVKSIDDSEAKKVTNFINAAVLPNKKGVAVFANDTWSALKARKALKVEWDYSNAETISSSDLKKEMLDLLKKKPTYQVSKNVNQDQSNYLLKQAHKVIDQTFYFPMLAHAPMEPLNCTIEPKGNGKLKVYDGCQGPSMAHGAVARTLKIPMENVEIETMFAGGSFGRRVSPETDYHVEAAMAFGLTDQTRPVKLVWSREDDIKGDYYRPAAAHRIRVGLDKKNNIITWDHHIVSQPIFKGTGFEKMLVHNGIDKASVEGIKDTLYQIPNMHVGLTDAKRPTRTLWWRAVGHTHTAYAMESMLDLVAAETNRDPVKLRLSLLNNDKDQKRFAEVIKLAAKKAKWGKKLKPGHSQGFAAHKSFQSYVAHVVEVSRKKDGSIQLEKVVSSVDCGLAINPDVIKDQIEGGAVYGIGHVMRNEISLKQGVVEQSNFPNYPPLRMSDVGTFETHIIKSKEKPTGVGEPGVPASAPAFSNAVAKLDKRIADLPMSNQGIKFA
jgi:isoquinoline 1-oxidoreductase beta subunit